MYRLLALGVQAGGDKSCHATGREGEAKEGSNNWVLAGRRTVSGKHCPPMIRISVDGASVWYFVAIEAPGLRVIGALAGLPGSCSTQ
jgi:acyl-homoserine lactone acylase PvdQ